ncbi:MAG TPA: proline racemase family protein [Terriglobales bacterium]|nr:proline racemase family protein [Terriglobales bacterium]
MHSTKIKNGTNNIRKIQIIDSHTGGEPTRLVIAGGPDLGDGPISERLNIFRARHDQFRSAVVNEPRGSDVIVGALLCEPHEAACSAGVIFFNNVGYLGMCGHGTIGLVVSLAYLGRIQPGEQRIETPVGIVTATLHKNGTVTVNNVPSYRKAAKVSVDVPGFGVVRGDIAWGGNWFFLVEEHGFELTLRNLDALTNFTWAVRQALSAQGITGDNDQEIDHIELFGPSSIRGVNSKNFVLCPGKAYDRSPCGTGTSAKLACLFADGKLREGQVWKQESIIGSVFEGRINVRDGRVYPSITGSAFVNSEAELLLDPRDPFCDGIRA